MKRVISTGLLLALLLSLCPVVQAAEAVTPTPPSWAPEQDYLIFADDPIYGPENWDEILELREKALAGTLEYKECSFYPNARGWDSIGRGYEMGLICLGGGYAYACDSWFQSARSKWREEHGEDEVYYQLFLWEYRGRALTDYAYYDMEQIGILTNILSALHMTLDDFYDAPFMDAVSETMRARIAENVETYLTRVDIFLDGKQIRVQGTPEIKNDRTMVPLRSVTEHLGAEVEWVEDTQQIVITRAGNTVIMTLDQTTAYLDGVPVEMDAAPYAIDGRTLIPVRYVAEFFGQTVTWDEENRRVDIYEDKSVIGDSNLEAWALAMGAMRGCIDKEGSAWFGQVRRSASTKEDFRARLSSAWNINSREDLIQTVCSMTYHGHNDDFLEAAAIANSLSDAQMSALIAQSSGADAYMWPQTKAMAERWGERGILFWDLSRMSNLVQWGYTAGYLTYPEALALLGPAAELTKEAFSSWDEAYDNYLDGYVWWSRTDLEAWRAALEEQLELQREQGYEIELSGFGPGWEWLDRPRGIFYYDMKSDPDLVPVLDDALFTQDIIPVPGVTAQQLLGAVLNG